MTEERKLELEVYRLETEKYLTDEGKKIMHMVRSYGKGKKGELKNIYKYIKKREDYIAELEELLLNKVYLENKLHGIIVMLGELGVRINAKVLNLLIERVRSIYN